MKKLKTVNKLEFVSEGFEYDKLGFPIMLVRCEDLRQEAIKLVKHNECLERACGCGFIDDREEEILKILIKYFFNITEDDLK